MLAGNTGFAATEPSMALIFGLLKYTELACGW
jgi:hypothetical protein